MVQRVSWDEFERDFRWEQGEHVSLIGPTKSGKTTLALRIIPRRRYRLVLAVKPRDPLISDLKNQGYYVTRTWPVPPMFERVVLWPKITSKKDLIAQSDTFAAALRDVYRQGSWAVYCDELQYITDARFLGLSTDVELLHQHGRALKVSLIGGTQRPAHVPLTTYSQATHLFLYPSRDVADVKRLREIGRVDPGEVVDALWECSGHECLYVNAWTGQMQITEAPPV